MALSDSVQRVPLRRHFRRPTALPSRSIRSLASPRRRLAAPYLRAGGLRSGLLIRKADRTGAAGPTPARLVRPVPDLRPPTPCLPPSPLSSQQATGVDRARQTRFRRRRGARPRNSSSLPPPPPAVSALVSSLCAANAFEHGEGVGVQQRQGGRVMTWRGGRGGVVRSLVWRSFPTVLTPTPPTHTIPLPPTPTPSACLSRLSTHVRAPPPSLLKLVATCSCMPTCTLVCLLLLHLIIVFSALLGPPTRLTRWLRGRRPRGRRHQQTPGRNSPPLSPTSTPRSFGRMRLPARRVSRWRYPVFQTFGGFGALALLLGDQHLLFVGAAPKGTLTDAEFKTASWGTFDFTALKRGLCVYTPTAYT